MLRCRIDGRAFGNLRRFNDGLPSLVSGPCQSPRLLADHEHAIDAFHLRDGAEKILAQRRSKCRAIGGGIMIGESLLGFGECFDWYQDRFHAGSPSKNRKRTCASCSLSWSVRITVGQMMGYISSAF